MFTAALFIMSEKQGIFQMSIINNAFHIQLKKHAKLNNAYFKDTHTHTQSNSLKKQLYDKYKSGDHDYHTEGKQKARGRKEYTHSFPSTNNSVT